MSNRIAAVDIQATRFETAEAELAIVVTPEVPADDLELRGRLMGPRCPYAETVEIAYHLRPLPMEDELPRARVIIPEASLWEPASPFLYQGPLELWQAGQCVAQAAVTYGLRNLILRPKGLRLNGHPFVIRGVRARECDETEARRLHDLDCNMLVTPVTPNAGAAWELGDRFGYFVLGQVDDLSDEIFWHAEEHLCPHTSCLGWLLPQTVLAQRQVWHTAVSVLKGHRQHLLMGIHLEEPFTGVLPGEVSFVVCSEQLLPELAATKLPKMLLTKGGAGESDVALPPDESVLGRIFKHAV